MTENTKIRDAWIKTTQVLLFRKVRAMQNRIYAEVLDTILSFSTDQENRLKVTAGNISMSDRVRLKINALLDKENKTLLSWLFKKFTELLHINSENFKSYDKFNDSIEQRAVKKIMLRYGYDVAKKQLIAGGYLSQIVSSESISLMAARIINESISAQVSLPDFRRRFKQVFTGGKTGLGVVDSHFMRFTGDIFAEFDRATNLEYANELDLEYFIYAGTEKDNTRPFCCEHLNNVYHVSKLKEWENKDWKGKNKNAPVAIALGGYNCRHMLNFISKELADQISGGNYEKTNKGC